MKKSPGVKFAHEHIHILYNISHIPITVRGWRSQGRKIVILPSSPPVTTFASPVPLHTARAVQGTGWSNDKW